MEAVDLDGSGRILVPERLVQFASLHHEVILLGVRDHMELWDARCRQAYMNQHGPKFDQVAEARFTNS